MLRASPEIPPREEGGVFGEAARRETTKSRDVRMASVVALVRGLS